MPQSLQEVQQDIDNALKEYPPKNITPGGMRTILKKAVQYVYDLTLNKLSPFFVVGGSVPALNGTDRIYRTEKVILGRNYSNGTGASLEATSAWIDNLNGARVTPFSTISSTTDTLAPTRWFAIAELPAPSGGTYDFAQVDFVGKPWDNNSGNPLELSIYFANRGGLRYQYTSVGDPANGTGIAAYTQPDGRTVIYIQTDNAFKAVSGRIKHSMQIIVYDMPLYSGNIPTGTETFNSTKPTVYRPLMNLRPTLTSFPIANADGAFPVPINESGAAQLSLGANWQTGSSDVSQINSNLAGGGFSWWQQTGAQAKRLLGHLNGAGRLLLNGMLKFPNATANRKVVLFQSSEDENQYFGFGVNDYTLRYQVPDQNQSHVFYAATSAATSRELMRVMGSGRVGMNISSPLYALDVTATTATGCADGVLARFENQQQLGALVQLHQDGVAAWRFGQPIGQDALVFVGWGNGAFPERARIDSSGRFLVGMTQGNDRDLLQVNGSISGKLYKQGGNPSSAESPTDAWRFVKNTSNGETRLWLNDNGTMKSVLLS